MDWFNAARQGDVEVLEKMIGKVDVHARDAKGNTAIVIASGRGQVEIIKILIAAGANVEDTSSEGLFEGKSCLMWASSQGRTDAVRILVQAGAEVNRIVNKGVFLGKTAIQWASSQGRAEVVLVLFAAGAVVDYAADRGNFKGKTALSWACSQGRLEAVIALIDAGADVNSADSEGVSPLMWAAGSEGGGDDEHKKGLLQEANKGDILAKVSRILIRYGADIDARDNDGITALMFAAFHGHASVVSELLRAGASTRFRNEVGLTAYHLAIGSAELEVAQVLSQGPQLLELPLDDLRFVPVRGWIACLLRSLLIQSGKEDTVSVKQIQENLFKTGLDVYMGDLFEIAKVASVREISTNLNLPNFGSTVLAAGQLQKLINMHNLGPTDIITCT
jgi:uncharacterized protein